MKSIFKLLFVALFFLNMQSVLAQTAEKPSGNGLETDPYKISTLENLYWLSQNPDDWSRYFIQTKDIDASATKKWHMGDHDANPATPDSAMGFSPIGRNVFKDFSGSYNGQGFTIKNLYINRPTENHVGLFGFVQTYTPKKDIRNIKLVNASIKGKSYVGSIVGYNNRTKLTNCSVSGIIEGTHSYVGGLVGENYFNAMVKNCDFQGTVKAVGDNVGGLIGKNTQSTLFQSTVSGTIQSSGNNIGGVVGRDKASIVQETSASIAVKSEGGYIGGLIGFAVESAVTDCYSAGSVKGHWDIGGLIGFGNFMTIKTSYTATLLSGYSGLGGLVGRAQTVSTIQSYWDRQISGIQQTEALSAKSTSEMLTESAYIGWDFGTTWKIAEAKTYPAFVWQKTTITPKNNVNGFENELSLNSRP